MSCKALRALFVDKRYIKAPLWNRWRFRMLLKMPVGDAYLIFAGDFSITQGLICKKKGDRMVCKAHSKDNWSAKDLSCRGYTLLSTLFNITIWIIFFCFVSKAWFIPYIFIGFFLGFPTPGTDVVKAGWESTLILLRMPQRFKTDPPSPGNVCRPRVTNPTSLLGQTGARIPTGVATIDFPISFILS